MDAVKIFALLLFLFVLLLPLAALRKALIVYLIGSLVLPYFHLGDLAIRFELIYAIWLTLILLAKILIKRRPLRWHPINSLYFLYFMVIVMSTLLALAQCGESLTWGVIAFYGLLRPLLVLILFMNVKIDERFVRSVLWCFLILSLGVNTLSVLQFLNVGSVTQITQVFYSSAFRTPIAGSIQAFSFLLRSVGVFESPVYNAIFILVVLLIAINMLLQKQSVSRRWILYLAIILAIIAGITTISSTFLLGAVVILGIIVWDNARYPMRIFRLAWAAVIVIAIIFSVGFLLLPRVSYLNGPFNYKLDQIISGQVFSTRYSPEEGNLWGIYEAVANRPLIGWGNVQQEGAFVGDSTYVATLYQGGIIGLLLFLSIFYVLIWRSSVSSGLPGIAGFINKLTLWVTILLLLVGIGAPSFYILRLQEWYWALVGLAFNGHLLGVVRGEISLQSKKNTLRNSE